MVHLRALWAEVRPVRDILPNQVPPSDAFGMCPGVTDCLPVTPNPRIVLAHILLTVLRTANKVDLLRWSIWIFFGWLRNSNVTVWVCACVLWAVLCCNWVAQWCGCLWMGEWKDLRRGGWVGRSVGGYLGGWVSRSVDGWVEISVDGWVGGWVGVWFFCWMH